MSDEIKLKPCPFCGNEAMTFEPDENRNVVRCRLGHAPFRSIEAWNTRVGDGYKRGVVDGMTASANFVAAAHLQGRDNDRMRLADSLRDEAKRVSEEK